MKIAITIALLLGLAAGAAFGQGAQGNLIKERARQATGQSGPQAPGGAPAAAAPARPAGMDPGQQANLEKFRQDLQAIKAGVPVTPAQKQELVNDVTILTRTAAKPSAESLVKLVTDLTGALADKSATVKSHDRLARSVNVVLNSANLAPKTVQPFVTTAQNVLKDGGVNPEQAQAVVADLKAILDEVQKAKAKPAGG